MQARMLLCGLSEDGVVKNHPSITCQIWNYVTMSQQGYAFDNDPRVMLLPDMEWNRQKLWNGKGFLCYVIGRVSVDGSTERRTALLEDGQRRART
eukprot:2649974-Rhodomonas_salina.1